jgi:hypothetical protein
MQGVFNHGLQGRHLGTGFARSRKGLLDLDGAD